MSLDGAPDPPPPDAGDTDRPARGDGGAAEGSGTTATATETEGLLGAVRAVVQQELRAALSNAGTGASVDDSGSTSTAAPPVSAEHSGEDRSAEASVVKTRPAMAL